MKILFLDFDGVMNSHQSIELYYNKWLEDGKPPGKVSFDGEGDTWCPIAISNLKSILYKMPDLGIVISSTWRRGTPIQHLRDLFYKHPVIAQAILDKTPVVGGKQRGYEIKQWIKHTDISVDEFVILDDDKDMRGVMRHFVHIDAHHGFMKRDADKALDILKYVAPAETEKGEHDLTPDEIAFRYRFCDGDQ